MRGFIVAAVVAGVTAISAVVIAILAKPNVVVSLAKGAISFTPAISF